MTKQNQTVPKLLIKLGYGYPINRDTQRHLYPRNILSAFLNVNPNNDTEIINFMNNYTYVPRDLRDPIKGFISDQQEIKQILFNIKKETISEDDITNLNMYLETVHPEIELLTETEIRDINKELGRNEPVSNNKKKYLVQAMTSGSPFARICLDLVKAVIEKQNLRQCLNCGKFLFINISKPRKYCNNNDECKSSFKQRRRRWKAKLKNLA